MNDKKYLSFGGGVNSVALYLWLKQQGMVPGIDFEAVMADPGAEDPRTYAYLTWMKEQGYPVTIVEGRNTEEGQLPLLAYCQRYAIIPDRRVRWCTMDFKLGPLLRYLGRDVDYIGIAWEERQRTVRIRQERQVEFPLVDVHLDRAACIEIIQAAGWPVPVKSGCYFCPYRSYAQFEELARLYPDLFAIVCGLEDTINARRGPDSKPVYFKDMPIRVAASGKLARKRWRKNHQGQMDFMDELALDPCPYCML